jgi:hypothetical protein
MNPQVENQQRAAALSSALKPKNNNPTCPGDFPITANLKN